MATTAHRSASETPDPACPGIHALDPQGDITGQLVSRIGELYAEEERRQRHERTDRLIQRAAVPGEE